MGKFTAPFKETIDTLTRNIVPYFRIHDPYLGFRRHGRIIEVGGTKAVIKNLLSDLSLPIFSIFKCILFIIGGIIDIIELLVRTIYIPVALILDLFKYKKDATKFNRTTSNLLTMLCCVLHCLELPINIAALALGNLILPIKILGRTIATIYHYKVMGEEEFSSLGKPSIEHIDSNSLIEEANKAFQLPAVVATEMFAQSYSQEISVAPRATSSKMY